MFPSRVLLVLALVALLLGPTVTPLPGLAAVFGVFSSVLASGLVSSGPVSGFSALALLACAPLALSAPAGSPRWDGALLEHARPVGDAQAGSFFSLVGAAGSVVEKIHIWRNSGKDQYVRGLQVFFSDGSSQMAGTLKSQHTEVRLGEGAHIVEMTMWVWKNKAKTRIARLALRTSTGEEFAAGFDLPAVEKLDSVPVSVGSGVLVGFEGKASDEVNLLKPVCLKKLDESRVDNVQLERFGKTQGLELVTTKQTHADWNGTDYNWDFSGNDRREESTSWSTSSSNSLSLGMSINFGIPFLTGASASASWGTSSSTSHSMNEAHSEEVHWGFGFTVKAPTTCVAQVWKGHLSNLRWTGRHTVVTADGASASFPISGKMTRKDSLVVKGMCYADGNKDKPIAMHRLLD